MLRDWEADWEEDEASGFRASEGEDILMHNAWILLTTGSKWAFLMWLG